MALLFFRVPNYTKEIPTLICKNGRHIKTFDVDGEFLRRSINKLTMHGQNLSDSQIQVFYKGAEFYIAVVSELHKDASERPSTFEIYGVVPTFLNSYTVDDWIWEVWNRSEDFSKEVDRVPQEEQLSAIYEKLLTIGHRVKRVRNFLFIGKLLLVLVSPILVALIIYISFQGTFYILASSCLIAANNALLAFLFRSEN